MKALTTEHARIAEAPPWCCPLCGDEYEGEHSAHPAAHCCLWHDFDYTTRVRIANRVESGATWLDAIMEQRK